MMSFSEKLKAARTELGYTQVQLAQEAGLCLQSILGYEKGRIRPRPATLARLADVLQVSTTYLSEESCENPLQNIEQDRCFRRARQEYRQRVRGGSAELLQGCLAFFTREDLPQQQKDKLFTSLEQAYLGKR